MDDQETFAFSMCNPPFFESIEVGMRTLHVSVHVHVPCARQRAHASAPSRVLVDICVKSTAALGRAHLYGCWLTYV